MGGGLGLAHATGLMFSSRLHADLRPSPFAELLAAKRASGTPLLDLTASNPTHAGLTYCPELLQAFTDPRALVYDASPNGLLSAREAVADYYARRGHTVSPEHILLTASTSEAYALLFKLLCDPGDDVLVPRPSYPLFELLADLESVQVRQYPLLYDHGWSYDLDALERTLTPRTRAVVLVNPNNPTGSFLKTHELARLVSLCAVRQLAVISDEVFADYPFGPDPYRVATLATVGKCLTFSLSGLSKVAGLPQMKLGWIVVNGPHTLRQTAYERLEFIADTYLSVSTPVQYAAPALIASHQRFQTELHARLQENLTALRRAIDVDSPLRLLGVEGGWYTIVQVPRIRSEEEWISLLLQDYNVVMQPGYFYDFDSEAFLVLSLLTPPDTFCAGLKLLLTLTR